MHYRNLNSVSTPRNGSPFVCLLLPFVCSKNPIILPLVGRNIPFVCNKGFSLVELIVALTIAGVLMAIAAPALQKFVSSNRLTGQVNDLMADINLSRSEAIKRNVTTGVCVTAAGGASCVTSGNWANGWLVYYDNAGTNVILKVHAALTGKNTLTSPGSVDQIVYSRNGLISSGTGQFTLTDPITNGQRIVCISATGHANLSGVNCT